MGRRTLKIYQAMRTRLIEIDASMFPCSSVHRLKCLWKSNKFESITLDITERKVWQPLQILETIEIAKNITGRGGGCFSTLKGSTFLNTYNGVFFLQTLGNDLSYNNSYFNCMLVLGLKSRNLLNLAKKS